MKLTYLDEPELEFGAGRHLDIRFGIAEYGPLDYSDPRAPKKMLAALVGTARTTEGVREWLAKCRDGIAAKDSKQPNLFPCFPGCNADSGLRTVVEVPDDMVRNVSWRELKKVINGNSGDELIRLAVDMFLNEIRYICQNCPGANLVICAIPTELLDAMEREDEDLLEDPEAETGEVSMLSPGLDFHDLLKAEAMEERKPVQIVLPATYDESVVRRRRRTGRIRRLQDEATRAWNFHTALYYKSGGTPWRLVRDSGQFTVCYVGVSFFKALDGSSLMTSVAQVFNERGEGVVVRGGPAQVSKNDRQPHVNAADANSLLGNALARYKEVHGNLPARLVIHKSSSYSDEEIEGFNAALDTERINNSDLLVIGASSTKLFRLGGVYPPLRGTFLSMDETEHVLYTKGSVDFFQTYPGMYVPSPIRIICASIEQTPKFLAEEILALTKMNWNNTQFDNSEPITLHAARQVSQILRYCKEGKRIEPRYSFYM